MEDNLASVVGQKIDELVEEHNNRKMFARSQWIYGKEGKIYLRATRRSLGGQMTDTIDLATIELDEQFWGRGVFSQVLTQVESKAQEHGRAVFVENVLSPIIDGALRRRGYHCRDNDELSSYWKNPTELHVKPAPSARKPGP